MRQLTLFNVAFLTFFCAVVSPVAAVTRDIPVVGEASTIVSLVTGTLGGEPREIVIKDQVFSQEVIETGPEAAAKLIFRDGSEFIMGASSRVTLDRFVYDSETGNGQLVMNMLSGVFEFASGLMRPTSYDLRTPFATLAIRGTRLVVDTERQFVYVRSANSSGVRSAVDIRLQDGSSITRTIDQGVVAGPQGNPQLCELATCPPPPARDPVTLPENEVDRQVIDLPVLAPRLVEAGADRPLVVVFGDLSRLALYPGAQARIERYSYNREKHAGELSITPVAGTFSFKSGKMPPASYHLSATAGDVTFRGTCTYGSADGFFVLRCPDLVTVTYKDGQVGTLSEGEGVSLVGGTLTSCSDAACNASLNTLSLALQRLAAAEQTQPGNLQPSPATINSLIRNLPLPSPDSQASPN